MMEESLQGGGTKSVEEVACDFVTEHEARILEQVPQCPSAVAEGDLVDSDVWFVALGGGGEADDSWCMERTGFELELGSGSSKKLIVLTGVDEES